LESQRGGIGLRGPGETQLETDRRLIRNRIKYITERLSRVRKQREQGRRARHKAIVPTVVLVGYTNAGKSTLFNHLTDSDVYVANRLFATLDPTLRRIDLPEIGSIILADTVGFIRHLPHDLVEAFYATLEEICEANLLLHVVDANDERREANIRQVHDVLEKIGGDTVPEVLIYNKIDLCCTIHPGIDRNANQEIYRVWISAKTGAGIEALKNAIKERVGADMVQESLSITPKDFRLRAILYQMGAVISEQTLEDGALELVVRMPKAKWDMLKK